MQRAGRPCQEPQPGVKKEDSETGHGETVADEMQGTAAGEGAPPGPEEKRLQQEPGRHGGGMCG